MFARHAKHLALLSLKDGGVLGSFNVNGLQTLILRCKHRREDEKTRKDSLSFNTNITVTGQECHVADLQTQYVVQPIPCSTREVQVSVVGPSGSG
jgi:hypothetical protein